MLKYQAILLCRNLLLGNDFGIDEDNKIILKWNDFGIDEDNKIILKWNHL